jgi:hypothetical protein
MLLQILLETEGMGESEKIIQQELVVQFLLLSVRPNEELVE